MKAFLLAAGKGTRLQPLTFDTPKCLVPVCGRPLMDYWFDLFRVHGIDEVLINTSYLADKVVDFIRCNSPGIKIKTTYEDNLLGSGGAIKKNWDFIENEEDFLICYADNLTNLNLSDMIEFHNSHKKDFTLAVLKVPNPEECGVIELDENSSILSFTEKPSNPATNLAFAGIMISNQALMNYFPDQDSFDLGHDVLIKIAGKASGFIVTDYLLDIGTLEKLDKAENDLKENVFSL